MKWKIREEERLFLEAHIEGIEELFDADDLEDLLDRINDEIVLEGFTEDQMFLTDYGKRVQRIWDHIFYDNYD